MPSTNRLVEHDEDLQLAIAVVSVHAAPLRPRSVAYLLVNVEACTTGFEGLPSECSWSVGSLELCAYATAEDACAIFLEEVCQRPVDCSR